VSETAALPPAGLCADCRHAELLRSPRSTFLRCRLADRDAAFPRYPALPVVACAGHEPLPPSPAGADVAVS
jgi:hypothetical protein